MSDSTSQMDNPMITRTRAYALCSRPNRIRARAEAARKVFDEAVSDYLRECDRLGYLGNGDLPKDLEEWARKVKNAHEHNMWWEANVEELVDRAWERFDREAYTPYVCDGRCRLDNKRDMWVVLRAVSSAVPWSYEDGSSGWDYESQSYQEYQYGTQEEADNAAWMMRVLWREHESGGDAVVDVTTLHYDGSGNITGREVWSD